MHNSEYPQLTRAETLVALYQLQNQLSLMDVIELDRLAYAGTGYCDDCHAECRRVSYGVLALCDRCALSRMAVRRLHVAQEAGEAS